MTSREDRLAGEVTSRIDGCPEADELQRFADDELNGEVRRRIGSHLESCSACTEAAAWLRGGGAAEDGDLAAELPAEVEARNERLVGAITGDAPLRGRTSVRRWTGLAAAAALAIVAVGVWQLRDSPGPREPVYRAADNGTVRSHVPRDRPLPRSDFVLRWSIDGEVSHYDLLVSTDALDPIAEVQGLTESEHRLDPRLLDGLEPGAKLIWQIEAVRPGGVRVRSDTFVTAVD
jgi:hypothetical protein